MCEPLHWRANIIGALHIITPGRPVTSVTCSTPGEYTPAHTLQGATGNLGTIALSVYSQVLIYG